MSSLNTFNGANDWFACSPSWGTFFPFCVTLLLSAAVVLVLRASFAVFLRMRTLLSSSGGGGGRIRLCTVRFTISGSNLFFRGAFFFLFKNASTSPLTIFSFSSTLLSYGRGSRGLRDAGPYWCFLPAALDVPLDVGVAGATTVVFLWCLLHVGAAGAGVATFFCPC